jgi:RNA polymerase sigma factor (sigma-70 family)
MRTPGDDRAGGAPKRPDAAQQRVAVLYRDHSSRLRRRLRAQIGSGEEANDLVQDAFARLLGAASLDRLREPEAFLNRIVRNLLIDRSRRLATRSTHVPIEGAADIPLRPEQADGIEVEQMRDRYRELVASLPNRMREVFILHRVEELSYKEIAARLDISVRTVEWHMAEAIVRVSRGLDAR